MALANGVRGAIHPCFLRAYMRLVFQEFFHVYPLDLGSSETFYVSLTRRQLWIFALLLRKICSPSGALPWSSLPTSNRPPGFHLQNISSVQIHPFPSSSITPPPRPGPNCRHFHLHRLPGSHLKMLIFFSSFLSYCNLEPNNESPFHGLGGPMIWPCPLSICILYLCLLTLQCFSPIFRGCTLAAPLCAGFCLIGSDLCCSVTSQLDACSRTSDQCLGFSTQ